MAFYFNFDLICYYYLLMTTRTNERNRKLRYWFWKIKRKVKESILKYKKKKNKGSYEKSMNDETGDVQKDVYTELNCDLWKIADNVPDVRVFWALGFQQKIVSPYSVNLS